MPLWAPSVRENAATASHLQECLANEATAGLHLGRAPLRGDFGRFERRHSAAQPVAEVAASKIIEVQKAARSKTPSAPKLYQARSHERVVDDLEKARRRVGYRRAARYFWSDELEQQVRSLQGRVQADEGSPSENG